MSECALYILLLIKVFNCSSGLKVSSHKDVHPYFSELVRKFYACQVSLLAWCSYISSDDILDQDMIQKQAVAQLFLLRNIESNLALLHHIKKTRQQLLLFDSYVYNSQ